MLFRSISSFFIKNLNKTKNFRCFSTNPELFPEIKPTNYPLVELKSEFENEELQPELFLFNDPEQGKIYEMAFKKTELAKRKRRRRKNGSKTNARYR